MLLHMQSGCYEELFTLLDWGGWPDKHCKSVQEDSFVRIEFRKMMTHPQCYSQQVPFSRHRQCFPHVYRHLQGVYCGHGWSVPLATLFCSRGRATDFHVYFSFRTLPLRRPPHKPARVAASIFWFNISITLVKSCFKTDFCKIIHCRCQDKHSSGAKLVQHNIDISNSTWLLVASWLFYIQNLPY